MGYLEELKRQADEALAQQTQDVGALQRNAMLTDSACQSTIVIPDGGLRPRSTLLDRH